MESEKENIAYSSFINLFDIYANTYNLHLFGKPKYKTLIGSLLGLISLILMITVALYFIIDLFQRKTMTIVYNEDTSRNPVNNLSDIPIMMTLGDYGTNVLPPDGLFSLDVKMLNYKRIKGVDGTSKLGLEIVPIQLEKCDLEKHFMDKGDLFRSLRISSYFCIPPGKYNLTVYGKLGDTLHGWSFLSIFLNRCNPKFQKCLNDTYAESVLGNSALSIAFLSNGVDHYNTTDPNAMKVETAVLPMSSSLLKNYYYNLRQVIYDTDYGFIFEDHTLKDFTTYYSQSLDVNLKSVGLPTIGPTFGYVMIKNSDAVSNYFRTYIKGQAVMANIGGLVKAIMIIAKIISDILTRRLSNVELTNRIFQYNIEDPKVKNKNKVNFLIKKESDLRVIPLENKNFNKHIQKRVVNNPTISESYAPESKSEIKLTVLEYICPMIFCGKNKKLDLVYQSIRIVNNKLSVEIMIEKYFKLDHLAKLVLNEKQLQEYTAGSKINFHPSMDNLKNKKFTEQQEVSALSDYDKSNINLHIGSKIKDLKIKPIDKIKSEYDLVMKNKFT